MDDRGSNRRIAAEGRRAPSRAPRGWHSRGYLPHFDSANRYQFITYRLADALPAEVALRLAHEPQTEEGNSAYYRRIESFLDTGYGSCSLGRAEVAKVVIDSWRYHDGVKYGLIAWVVMPNHVHLLVRMGQASLSDVLQEWKGATSHWINRLLGRCGAFWQADY